MQTSFGCLLVGAVFEMNGTKWLKQSKRTASLVEHPGRWFYVGLDEQVKKERH